MSELAGTGGLVRLILRRDRFLLPLWTLLLGLIPIEYATATQSLFTTDAAREVYFRSIVGNPGLTALLGPAYNSSLGALTAWRSGMMLVIVGLASLLTVIRHTRTDEEAGRRGGRPAHPGRRRGQGDRSQRLGRGVPVPGRR